MNKKLKKVLIFAGPLILGVSFIAWINKRSRDKMNKAEVIPPGKELNIPLVPVINPSSSVFPLKNGSNNSKVKELQAIIGVSADGAFGPKTEAALLSFAGIRTVDSQAKLDELKKQAAGSTSLARAKDLVDKFKKGGYSLFVSVEHKSRQVIQDAYGALIDTGKSLQLFASKVYNNTDYKLIGTTKQGNVLLEITSGNLKGLYILDADKISLKAN